ncbi:BgTH12-03459 [Blumeria graminis f. sp. triticale]|uniref:BgTH12-03459 n=1 Tax=Blumeria graminis f. sp. triticale TaxID=1689686 RepID=A0A9W4CVL2_BLUGR|nr:BgTH12-03459 [Blumeria graminis f. sp. triticale]
MPCDTSDDDIFEFINFDGDEGLPAENEKIVGSSSQDIGLVQNVSNEDTNFPVQNMTIDYFLETWKYDNGVPDVEEIIEMGFCWKICYVRYYMDIHDEIKNTKYFTTRDEWNYIYIQGRNFHQSHMPVKSSNDQPPHTYHDEPRYT